MPLNIRDLIAEHLGVIKPSVFVVRKQVEWVDCEDSDGEPVVETMTFICKEWPSGRRTFDVDVYGRCLRFQTWKKHQVEFKIWAAGGKTPVNEPVFASNVVRLK